MKEQSNLHCSFSFFYFWPKDRPMSLALIRCSVDHLDELVVLSKRTFRDAFEAWNDPVDFKNYLETAFHEETLAAQLENPDTEFYFVKRRGKTLGYLKVNQNKAQTDVKMAETMELERIYVLGRFQNRGIGEWMLQEIKQMAHQKGKKFLWLGVWEKNTRAIQFYQKQGFINFGTHPYFIGKDEQTDWLMRFDLTTLGNP